MRSFLAYEQPIIVMVADRFLASYLSNLSTFRHLFFSNP